MTTTALDQLRAIDDDERATLLGLAYGSSIEREIEQDREDFAEEREHLDDQILAGLVLPW